MPLLRIGGVSAHMRAALRACRISNTAQLIDATRSPEALRALADHCGVEPTRLARLVDRARLRQVQGVGLTYASMLEMLDINTPERLSTCDAGDLARQLGELNRREILVRRTPGEAEIERWIEGAAFVAGGRRETGHHESKSRPHPRE
ncbi:MAG: DUF4332 domain-containing protein [Geminicoccaceae bacterium]